MRKLASAIAVLAIALTPVLSGCVTSKQIVGPAGKPVYAISCNGGLNNWNDCFEKAGEICGDKGYDMVDRAGEVVSGVVGTGNGGFAGGSGNRRSMMVSCKA